MRPIVERACGLDIGEAIVVATLLVGKAHEEPRKVTRSFGTFTRDLEQLRDWLRSEGCTHVGMESTGVYWIPIYAVLEGGFELIVGNARHIKNVPGRKTDVKDSEWIAELVRYGLISKSFVPPAEFRELRDLLRYRRKLVENRSAERNRVLRQLETANIKLAAVATDVFGVSGKLMLRALIEGRESPNQMAELAKKGLRKKIPALRLALEGHLKEHHRFLLTLQLDRLERFDDDIARIETRVTEQLKPFAAEHRLLMQIPGVDWVVAASIIAEIGIDMTIFRSIKQVTAWAGVCPGNHESAGKRRNVSVRKGNVHLKPVLMQAANAAARAKGTYLQSKFFRLKARRGHKRAAMAIAHKILSSAFCMLAGHCDYVELGASYLDQLGSKRLTSSLVRRLERMGYEVQLKPKAA